MTEEELLQLLLEYLPETFTGWAAVVCGACAVVSLAVPAPSEDAHWVVKAGHRVITILGLGAGKLKTMGKLGALARVFRK